MTENEALELSALLYARETLELEIADDRLRAKCHWEQVSRMAVLMEWGDPRK